MLLPSAILLTLTLTRGHAWDLRLNVDEVTPGVTRDVMLTCRLDSGGKEDDTLRLKQISRVRIVKQGPFNRKTIYADFNLARNRTSKIDDSLEVKSNAGLNDQQQPTLQVTWATATKETVGVYGCEVVGYDKSDNFVSHIVSSTTIKETSVTMEDVDKRIQSTVEGYEKKIEILEAKNTNLERKFATLETKNGNLMDDLKMLKKEIENYEERYRTELSTYKKDLEVNYVTKVDFANNISMVKNFTLSEIISNHINDHDARNDLEKKIKDAEDNCHTKYLNLNSALADLKSVTNGRLNNLKQSFTDTANKINETLTSAAKRTAFLVDARLENATNTLRNDLEDAITEQCGCGATTPHAGQDEGRGGSTPKVTTSTTTPPTSTTPHHVVEWPDKGSYALLRAGSECPNPTTSRGRMPLFEPVPYNASRVDKTYITTIGIWWFIDARGNTTNAYFCRKKQSADPSKSWPPGTYCIHKYGGSCPSSFSQGNVGFEFDANFFGVHKIYKYLLEFCCTRTGNVAVPISLPREKSFNLFRYGGKCQKVKGMKVAETKLQLNGQNPSAHSDARSAGHLPDILFKQRHLAICQYIPDI